MNTRSKLSFCLSKNVEETSPVEILDPHKNERFELDNLPRGYPESQTVRRKWKIDAVPPEEREIRLSPGGLFEVLREFERFQKCTCKSPELGSAATYFSTPSTAAAISRSPQPFGGVMNSLFFSGTE